MLAVRLPLLADELTRLRGTLGKARELVDEIAGAETSGLERFGLIGELRRLIDHALDGVQVNEDERERLAWTFVRERLPSERPTMAQVVELVEQAWGAVHAPLPPEGGSRTLRGAEDTRREAIDEVRRAVARRVHLVSSDAERRVVSDCLSAIDLLRTSGRGEVLNEALLDRLRTLVDEQVGIQPVLEAEELFTLLEEYMSKEHRRGFVFREAVYYLHQVVPPDVLVVAMEIPCVREAVDDVRGAAPAGERPDYPTNGETYEVEKAAWHRGYVAGEKVGRRDALEEKGGAT